MSKKEYNRNDDAEAMGIFQSEKKIKRAKKNFRAECTHVSKNGKRLLEQTKTKYIWKCKRCGAKIDFRAFLPTEDQVEGGKNPGIEKAEVCADTLRNLVEVMKVRTAQEGSKDNSKIIKNLAETIKTLNALPGAAEAIVNMGKPGKGKNKKKGHAYHLDGMDALSLGKSKKRKW
jgi:ribosomal protein L37AE/L43A